MHMQGDTLHTFSSNTAWLSVLKGWKVSSLVETFPSGKKLKFVLVNLFEPQALLDLLAQTNTTNGLQA